MAKGTPIKGDGRKPWPVLPQMLSWFLYEKFNHIPIETVCPEMIEGWLAEFDDNTRTTPQRIYMHRHFWDQYAEFKDKFSEPDPYSLRRKE